MALEPREPTRGPRRTRLDRRSALVQGLALLLLALLTFVDYATGYELGLFVLYLGPVSLVAWYASRRRGLAVAVLAAACWYASDRLADHPYSSPYLIYWETFMRLVSFATTALSLSAIREGAQRREAVREALSGDLRPPLAAITAEARALESRFGRSSPGTRSILRATESMERCIGDLVVALDGRRGVGRARGGLGPAQPTRTKPVPAGRPHHRSAPPRPAEDLTVVACGPGPPRGHRPVLTGPRVRPRRPGRRRRPVARSR
jgi:hypothetical protein